MTHRLMITAHTLLKCKSLLTRIRILGFRFRVWGQGNGKEGCWRFGYEELQGRGKTLQEWFCPKNLQNHTANMGASAHDPQFIILGSYFDPDLLDGVQELSYQCTFEGSIFNLQSLHPLFSKHYLAPLAKETLGEFYQFIEVFSSV